MAGFGNNIARADGYSGKRRSVTETDTIERTDFYIGCNQTAPITLTISDDLLEAQMLIIKDESNTAESNPITLQVEGGATIDGSSTFVINGNLAAINLISDGTNWHVF